MPWKNFTDTHKGFSKLDGWWFIFLDEVGLGVLGPNFEDLLDRLKVLAGNLFRARGETVAGICCGNTPQKHVHVRATTWQAHEQKSSFKEGALSFPRRANDLIRRQDVADVP